MPDEALQLKALAILVEAFRNCSGWDLDRHE